MPNAGFPDLTGSVDSGIDLNVINAFKSYGKGTTSEAQLFDTMGISSVSDIISQNAAIVGGADALGLRGTLSDTNNPATPQTAASVTGSSGGLLSGVANYFERGIIIILGFIFVAIGLSMFKSPAVIQAVSKIKGAS